MQLLRPWARNLGKRVIQTPKVYLNDSGLLAHSLGATVDRLRSEGNLAGAVLENFVLMELRKQCAWSATRPELFYWRTASGQEVDIVVEDRAGRVVGIEVKAAATLGGHDIRGLQALADAVGKKWVAASCSMPAQRSFHSQPISTEFLWVDSGLSGKSDSCANTKKRTEIRHSGRAISCNVSMQWWLLWEPWDRVFSNLQATLGKTTFEHH